MYIIQQFLAKFSVAFGKVFSGKEKYFVATLLCARMLVDID